MEGQHEKFVAAVRKREILAATKVKMSRSEKKKKNKNTYDISFIKRVTRTFLELSRCSRAKQGQRNVQKKRDARSKLLFCSLDLLLFFHWSRCLRHLALHDFIFCWSKLSRASLLALAKSIYFHNISYSGDDQKMSTGC